MRGVFKWSGLVLAGLVAAVVLLYVISRLMPIPEDEARALAMLDAPREATGRNGFAALMALRYDVPADELEQVLAEDVRRFAAVTPAAHDGSTPGMFTSGLERYPSLDAGSLGPAPCSAHEGGCLEKVRALPDNDAATIEARKLLSARVAALDGYDYFRSPFAGRFDTPIPAYQPLMNDLTAHAHAFVQGDTEVALAGVCRNASIARKLVASGDSLIGSMVGAAMMKGSASLFVEMLSKLPADYPVPARCRQVFKPDGAMTAGICPTMTGEGRYSTSNFRSMNALPEYQEWHARLTLDVEKTAAIIASQFTWFCGSQANRLIRRDQPLVNLASAPVRWSLRCLANPTGCILVDIQAPAYIDYSLRLQDAEARQKLVATWLWLRDEADQSLPLRQRLDARPDALKSPSRQIEIVDGGKALRMRMYEDSHGASWTLPLPPWLQDLPSSPPT